MDVEKYFEFLAELCRILDEITALEQQKIQAIQNNDLALLHEYMKQEQAVALQLRGQEQKRTALLRQLGLENTSLRQLSDLCPPPLQNRAREVVQQVQDSYQVLSSAQSASRTLMESKLRAIQGEMERREEVRPAPPSASGVTHSDFRA